MDKGVVEGEQRGHAMCTHCSDYGPMPDSDPDKGSGLADELEPPSPLLPCNGSVSEKEDIFNEEKENDSSARWTSDEEDVEEGGCSFDEYRSRAHNISDGIESTEAEEDVPGLIHVETDEEDDVSDDDGWETVEDGEDEEVDELEIANEFHGAQEDSEEFNEEELLFTNMDLFGNLLHLAERHSLQSHGGPRIGSPQRRESGQVPGEDAQPRSMGIWANPPQIFRDKPSHSQTTRDSFGCTPGTSPLAVDSSLLPLLWDLSYMDSLFALLPGVDSADDHLQVPL